MQSDAQFGRATKDDTWRAFDAAAQQLLHVTGEEFAQGWDRGDYAASDEIDVMRVAMLRPSGR